MSKFTLDQQREQFRHRRFLAMPLAGMIVWTVIGFIGFFANSMETKIWSIWLGSGAIFYLGICFAKLTGEDFFNRKKEKNEFDNLFMAGVVMALLVFSIVMPFAMKESTSIPMSVGILGGLMWMPLSWAIQHWIGYFHSIARTLAVTICYFVSPEHTFVTVPAVIVVIYIISIIAQEKRYAKINGIKNARNVALKDEMLTASPAK
ncbi:DUF7010 family protein [Aliiglaciecola lipolytica]|uniref:Uncharacterized protein n=1 Tax=Aliiglaciecola lipolytica E3 TaxID=1127673 RepID=K6XNI2_9ALTE|nr:hypothetical protein [Aliiglaciecola lipolytica]GAC13241.1 hypothetical protein GLIP_0595 [Aliiglaciecola lipolytica E3]